jgi:hypothetical protein
MGVKNEYFVQILRSVGYCKNLRVVRIELPYISQVNYPLECLPIFYSPDAKDSKQNCEKEEKQRKNHEEWKQQTLLLSISATAQNTVMWSHYSEKHKGAVIGIDVNKIIPGGISALQVKYSKKRPRINILTDIKDPFKAFHKIVLTKSIEWKYEREFRAIFDDEYLKNPQEQDSACLKVFNGKKTWFLRLDGESIREVIFGLYTEESLKSSIRKLIERAKLQHVKLYQAEESETYNFNLVEMKKE